MWLKNLFLSQSTDIYWSDTLHQTWCEEYRYQEYKKYRARSMCPWTWDITLKARLSLALLHPTPSGFRCLMSGFRWVDSVYECDLRTSWQHLEGSHNKGHTKHLYKPLGWSNLLGERRHYLAHRSSIPRNYLGFQRLDLGRFTMQVSTA